VFVEAAAISDDERLDEGIETLVRSLRSNWPARGDVWSAMQSIDACLAAARRLSNEGPLVAAAVDELERVVGLAYEPGEGLLGSLRPRSSQAGGLRDHVAAASALLSAYAIAGRLPYSMLAEELIQFARRTWWDATSGGFWRTSNAESQTLNPANAANPANLANPSNPSNRDLFVWNCQAARVLCRLAALHEDPEYRAVAVIAHQSDYAGDATRTLDTLEPGYRDRGLEAAIYGVALGEWLAMR
jgi:uncharacterized protein YyaL (SSP411 family)